MKPVPSAPYLLAFGLALLMGCSGTEEALYINRAAADQAGAFKPKWLPDWVPAEATSIRLATVTETREFMLQFALASDKPLELPADCKPIAASKPPGPPLWRNWWPHDVPPNALVTPRHTFVRCKDYYVAFSTSQGDVYAWMKR